MTKKKNLHEEGNLTKKMRENPWIVSTFILGTVCLILIVGNFIPEYSPESVREINVREINLCLMVSVTPSWVKDNQIVGQGYVNFDGLKPSEAINLLINDNIIFVYHSDCGACKSQIEYFGESWKDYVDSNLVVNCKN